MKNYLFHAAQGEGWPIEELYNEYWRTFDEDESFWRAEVTQGRLRRPSLDVFLQHYLALTTRDEVPASHLFTSFRDYIRRTQGMSAGDHLSQLAAYASIYRKLASFEADSREGLFFYRLDLMETGTVIPFLMELLKQTQISDDREHFLEILVDIESFLVRRMVCRLTTKNYNLLFLDLVQRVRQQGSFSPGTVRRYLAEQTGDSRRWPDDQEFRRNWLQQPLYTAIVRKRLRMILEALELRLFDPRSERVRLDDKLQIEHLMPQSWEDHWPLPSPGTAEAESRRNHLLHTIGNLTLITRTLNPSISNGSWNEKLSDILDHSALSLNRPLRQRSRWTEEDIEDRSERLFEVACQIWPRRDT